MTIRELYTRHTVHRMTPALWPSVCLSVKAALVSLPVPDCLLLIAVEVDCWRNELIDEMLNAMVEHATVSGAKTAENTETAEDDETAESTRSCENSRGGADDGKGSAIEGVSPVNRKRSAQGWP